MAGCWSCTAKQTNAASVTCALLRNTEAIMSSQWKWRWPINRSEVQFKNAESLSFKPGLGV